VFDSQVQTGKDNIMIVGMLLADRSQFNKRAAIIYRTQIRGKFRDSIIYALRQEHLGEGSSYVGVAITQCIKTCHVGR
jgi:hypothetical protein